MCSSRLTMLKFVLQCVFLANLVLGANLPKGVDKCKYNDSKCMLDAVKKALPILYSGDPKINLLPFDPLQVTRITIDQLASTSNIKIKLSLIDSEVFGLKDAVFESISGATKSPSNFKMSFKAKIKLVKLSGNYEMDGKFILIPLSGKGHYNLTLDNMDVACELIGEPEPIIKKGKEYLQLKNFNFNFDTDKLSLYFEGLHNGDKTLGESTNRFLNENWKDVLADLKPSIQQALSEILKELSNRIFAKVPYSNAFIIE